jgi:dTDP-4-amino-4,6-dideoxygalactose transaminase
LRGVTALRTENPPLYVTRPSCAPFDEYSALLKDLFDRAVLTNHGPLVQQLEAELQARLGVSHCIAVTNGTVALQMAIRALGLRGEIVTTPFSWVASCTAIQWEHCAPVFCDIDARTFNIDPARIEDCITERTSAILAVHCFSAPCDVHAICAIARRRNLKVIYDGAHANFVRYHGQSLLAYGDVSATSFHATKIFNTGEGGGCTTEDAALADRLRRIRYFGHEEWRGIVDDGWNGKMSEIHAALGLANLRHLDQWLSLRRTKHARYCEQLSALPFLRFQCFDPDAYNYGYMPVVFETEAIRGRVESQLKAHGVFPRRYFYPSLNRSPVFAATAARMPIAEQVADCILCLPMFPDIRDDQIDNVCNIIGTAA